MGQFVVPNLTGKQMGKVLATLTLTNLGDRLQAMQGAIATDQVRSITLNNVLVDTGATLLCLPDTIINQLGLTVLREVDVATAAGFKKARIFQGVNLSLAGREGTFDCLELPGGQDALLGVIPLEALGLEPDLPNQRLRVLPMNPNQTYLTIL